VTPLGLRLRRKPHEPTGRRAQNSCGTQKNAHSPQARRAALNQLHALVVTAPDALRARLRGLANARLITTAAALRSRDGVCEVLRRVAQRAQYLASEIAEIDRSLLRLTSELAPGLLAECGVGAVCAAQLLVSSGDPQRMTSEASFAALAGTSPVDASSGKQQRHRLNRGGDRQLNWALHVITIQRVRHHAETAAYYQRLRSAGKTTREAKRCIKRALARHFYHQLRQQPPTTLTT
jgi:transposase